MLGSKSGQLKKIVINGNVKYSVARTHTQTLGGTYTHTATALPTSSKNYTKMLIEYILSSYRNGTSWRSNYSSIRDMLQEKGALGNH